MMCGSMEVRIGHSITGHCFVKILRLIILILLASAADLPADDPLPIKLSWAETAAQIDRLFESAWQREQVVPAEIASDQEFIRRIYLDLAGRVPAVSEVREFLASSEASRRNDIVEELLQDPAYIRHMTIVWRNALIPQAMTQQEFRPLIPGFDAWLWERLADNIPYDQIVREIITSNVLSGEATSQAVANTTSPDAFFVVRGLMPESLATGTARAFL